MFVLVVQPPKYFVQHRKRSGHGDGRELMHKGVYIFDHIATRGCEQGILVY